MATKTPARARKSTASNVQRPPARTDSTRPYALIKRKAWESKEQILTAGSAIQALSYQRTSGVTRGSETSVEDQQVENSEHIAARSWVWADTYTDNNKSASRHGKKVRADMLRLKADILAGAGDVLVMCEVTRQTRQLREFAELVDICRAEGLRWWYVGGTLFDLEYPDDQVLLGLQAMLGQREAEIAAKRNRRAQKGSARRGRPHGPVRYGYIRLYDAETRDIAEESPDEKPRRYHGPDGSWFGRTPTWSAGSSVGTSAALARRRSGPTFTASACPRRRGRSGGRSRRSGTSSQTRRTWASACTTARSAEKRRFGMG